MIPAGPDAARRTSERRRRVRLSAAVAAAVVVTASASVVAYDLIPRGWTPDVATTPTPTAPPPSVAPTETPTPTTAPSPTSDGQPTAGPNAVTLQLSDVPAGYRYEGDTILGDWTLEFAASTCAPPNPLAGIPSATAQWEAWFLAGTDPYMAINQRVANYRGAIDAEAYVEAVSRLARECVQEFGDPRTWTIEHQGFAGDESLVLRADGAGSYSTYIVVRVAGLVTQIWYPDTVDLDPVLLGQRAAARMCAGTTAC